MGAAIEIDDVSKRFRLYHEKPDSLKERFVKLGRLPYEEFWALRNITLHVAHGETVGLLGHNGSGKSTLLKCVAGILRPTFGTVAKAGRTAALLELGAGFHPELTGRENVYLNGSILGLSRSEIDEIFDDVVEFSELERFIDSQVKHYSSGMVARLGFAVAVNVHPEILLIDEVLAVGDEAFQRRCLDRIRQFQREGRTILLVTHAADLVRQICDRVAVLDQGEMIALSLPGEAVMAFRDSLMRRGIDPEKEGIDTRFYDADPSVRIAGVKVAGTEAGRSYVLPGEPLEVEVALAAERPVTDVTVVLSIVDQEGRLVYGTDTDIEGVELARLSGPAKIIFRFPEVPLLEGVYPLRVSLQTRDGGLVYDQRSESEFLEVMNPHTTRGIVNFRASVGAEGDVTLGSTRPAGGANRSEGQDGPGDEIHSEAREES